MRALPTFLTLVLGAGALMFWNQFRNPVIDHRIRTLPVQNSEFGRRNTVELKPAGVERDTAQNRTLTRTVPTQRSSVLPTTPTTIPTSVSDRFTLAWYRPRTNMSTKVQQIPAQVWQTFNTATFASPHALYITKMRDMNPHYDFHLVNDSMMLSYMRSYTAHPQIKKAFFSINPAIMAARADLWRYAVLYDVGGVYIDIDSECTALDDIIKADDLAILSWAGAWHRDTWKSWWAQVGYTRELDQWTLFFAPRHPLLHLVMTVASERVLSDLTMGKSIENMHEHVLGTTGPKLFMAALEMYKNEPGKQNHETATMVREVTEDFDGRCQWKVLGYKDSTLDRFVPKGKSVHYSSAKNRVFADTKWSQP
eukprot:m.97158 g.97158  ORF g.97158 m.97158 type:complete len:366 (-) comp26955_c1_seq1:33-1130(-)